MVTADLILIYKYAPVGAGISSFPIAGMTQSPKLVLVTGATGRQGRALIHALLNPSSLTGSAPTSQSSSDSDPEFHILALTRKASSPSAKSLGSQPNVTIVEGNLDSLASIRLIFENAKSKGGIWGVFCVLAFPGLGANADGEEVQGKALADISMDFGVSTFVFSSVERGGERDDDKAVLDRLAKNSDFDHSILRPGFFMENYEGAIGSITVSVLKTGLQTDTTIQLIAVDDIGQVAAGVLKDPRSFQQQILLVVGERSTIKDQEESYKRATGHSLPSYPSFVARGLIAMNGHTKGLIADIERVHKIQEEGAAPDCDAQLLAAKKAYSGLRTFEMWATSRKPGKSMSSAMGSDGVSKRDKDWNKVTIGRLVSGKQ
ncbi:hypothetical protein D9757_011639 [Collybiopsis confluens]|uniref:NmrA-like domain-containing protein n=1 Tax=Collybiopsis confluens TaxID=2823264 RepID=A0A8H5LX18_9AGAR|nr:hypothetical protein D9757_011639 [Collybiopsis confluens]